MAAGSVRRDGTANPEPARGKIDPMKEVIAVVKPFLAERVLEALKLAPLEACTVREVKGYGRQKSYLDQYGESEYSLAFLPKVEIQLWVEDARVAEVIERITAAARTGRMGDGKIFVLPATEHGPGVGS
jgi:nitrogen regulatory protein PII